MKRKGLFKLVAAVCLAAVIAIPLAIGCAAPAPAPAPVPEEPVLEPFTVKVGIMSPKTDHWVAYRFEPMMAFVEEVAQGRATIEPYYGTEQFGWKDALQAVETGLSDWVIVWNPLLPGRFPLMDLFSLPGIAEEMLVSSWVMQILWEEFPQFEAQFLSLAHGDEEIDGDEVPSR